MSEAIEKYEKVSSKALRGQEVEYRFNNENLSTGQTTIKYWFAQLEMGKSLLSVCVELTASLPSKKVNVLVQTDFNVYPYADVNSLGEINTPIISKMFDEAISNGLDYIKKFCGDNNIPDGYFKKEEVKYTLEIIEPITN